MALYSTTEGTGGRNNKRKARLTNLDEDRGARGNITDHTAVVANLRAHLIGICSAG